MRYLISILLLLLALPSAAQPLLRTTLYSRGLLTNETAASSRTYLGITGSTNILVGIWATNTGTAISSNAAGSWYVNTNLYGVPQAQFQAASNDLREGGLIFSIDFDQTNGVGSNVLAGALPRIGTFRHATGVGGVAPTAMVPMITNSALTYLPTINNGTVYICWGVEGTKSIKRSRIVYRLTTTYGAVFPVTALLHWVGNGEFVAAGDLMLHGGWNTGFDSIGFDGHLAGFGSFTQPTVSSTTDGAFWWAYASSNNLQTVEYWIDGTNLLGHVNGRRFTLPYPGATNFNNVTNLILQFYSPGDFATSGQNPEVISIKAWDSPYPAGEEMNVPTGLVAPIWYNPTFRLTSTNDPGFRMIGRGSNSIETITTISATNYYAISNTAAAATIAAGITEGGGWWGIISNGWHAAWRTNGNVLWKRWTP